MNYEVDYRSELERFEWTGATWSDDKLIAASPFRYDKSPSFYCYLRDTPSASAGSWGDSGAYDADHAKGGFIKLLAFLRQEDEESTADYLREVYAPSTAGSELVLRIPQLKVERTRQTLDEALIAELPYDTAYLPSRGISANTAKAAGVRANGNSVAIPWRLPNGKLANVKYRATRGKTFWYAKGGVPIRDLVYGLDAVYAERSTTAVICEAEIDALSLRTIGVMAVAVGGASFSEQKRDLIMRSPIEELIVLTDNDKAGGKLRAEIEQALVGRMCIKNAYVDNAVKDVNEALVRTGGDNLRRAVEQAVRVREFPYFALRLPTK
ncbi:MAG: toprim domain-containing protein [Bacillota bacterium]